MLRSWENVADMLVGIRSVNNISLYRTVRCCASTVYAEVEDSTGYKFWSLRVVEWDSRILSMSCESGSLHSFFAVSRHYFLPGERLPSQTQTTAIGQYHIVLFVRRGGLCVNNFPIVVKVRFRLVAYTTVIKLSSKQKFVLNVCDLENLLEVYLLSGMRVQWQIYKESVYMATCYIFFSAFLNNLEHRTVSVAQLILVWCCQERLLLCIAWVTMLCFSGA